MTVEKLAHGPKEVRVIVGRVVAKCSTLNEQLDELYERDVDLAEGGALGVSNGKIQPSRMRRGEVVERVERACPRGVAKALEGEARDELLDGGHRHALEASEVW